MTAPQILDYIAYEPLRKSAPQLTKVIYKDGRVLMGKLLKRDQNIDRSLKTNKWVYQAVGGETLELDGDMISELKIG